MNSEEKQVMEALSDEIYFQNPTEEFNYFLERTKEIASYSNQFFREMAKVKLANRYIRALAKLRKENNFDSEPLSDVYYDILDRLGIDTYTIDKEIDDYIKTHEIDYSNKDDIVVSSAGKSI